MRLQSNRNWSDFFAVLETLGSKLGVNYECTIRYFLNLIAKVSSSSISEASESEEILAVVVKDFGL